MVSLFTQQSMVNEGRVNPNRQVYTGLVYKGPGLLQDVHAGHAARGLTKSPVFSDV